ncbi:CPBP family intramembrane glutamic endopeptidase [Staphylococcus hyicus]|uniref:CPBP family intramembrane glutamic endopeptidase n=1 Tax=Staphylococcus hyicus TaxID=1284 RepID=UPI003132EC34
MSAITNRIRKETKDFILMLNSLKPFIFILVVIAIRDIAAYKPDINLFLWGSKVFLTTIVFSFLYIKYLKPSNFTFNITGKTIVISILCFLSIEALHILQNLLGLYETPRNQELIESKRLSDQDHIMFYFIDSVIVAPIFEEFIFRGFLYAIVLYVYREIAFFLNNSKNKDILFSIMNIIFVIGSTYLFASTHITDSFKQLIPFLLIGLLLAIVYLITKNLLSTILIHMFNNLFAFFQVSLTHTTIIVTMMLICTLLYMTMMNKVKTKN